MEEVDNIIIHSLRSIGCDLDNDLVSLKQFSTEVIVQTVSKCIKSINNDVQLPQTLPASMSARFRVGASLANNVQDLGYKGEIGYQTFLYSSESEIRKVFMFLVEKLPKDNAQTSNESIGASHLIRREISSKISQQISRTWIPFYLKNNGLDGNCEKKGREPLFQYHSQFLQSPHVRGDIKQKIPKEIEKYYQNFLPLITNQSCHVRDTIASVIEFNSTEVSRQQEWENEWSISGILTKLSQKEYIQRKKSKVQKMILNRLQQYVQRDSRTVYLDLQQLISSLTSGASTDLRNKGSRFAHSQKLVFAKDDNKCMEQFGVESVYRETEEEQKRNAEEEVSGLEDELNSLVSELDHLGMEINKFNAIQIQIEESVNSYTIQQMEKENVYNIKKRTMDLLPSAEDNIKNLQEVVEVSSRRLLALANKWEVHRHPLIHHYRELIKCAAQKEYESKKTFVEIQAFREKIKEVAEEVRKKEELQKQLKSEYESVAKDVNRSAYTRKILEIVGNIKKQKQEIAKVLLDTKNIQKEINSLSGKLDRTFTVTDELIFKDAMKDEGVKKAYRLLAALHENCELLISNVEETGVVLREIRDLEDQIENENGKKVVANLDQITSDFHEMKKENASMLNMIKPRQ